MKILIMGGSGTISTALTARLALTSQADVFVVNRGNKNAEIDTACEREAVLLNLSVKKPVYIQADCKDEARMNAVVADLLKKDERFDAVIDFIAFTQDDAARDKRVFSGKTKQYIFISSASAYCKPLNDYRITESTPLANPFWRYSRDKIACENLLTDAFRSEGFPVTIIRPSHTYCERSVPLGLHGKEGSWQVVRRMLDGKSVIIHGDGTSLWTMTHSRDFARALCALVCNARAVGETVQITGDESLTWNQIYGFIVGAAGVPLRAVHISSDFLIKAGALALTQSGAYDFNGTLLGDKAHSVVFDNAKLKRLTNGFCSQIRFEDGVRETIHHILKHPELQRLDPEFDAWCDKVIAAQKKALDFLKN
ncbi:NAD-dependent epimerase/dehydratase family protein [Treponema maltophilum]|nr:NAD-dependent epimerase/dehydratase family protein [Treponema maltophilum]